MGARDLFNFIPLLTRATLRADRTQAIARSTLARHNLLARSCLHALGGGNLRLERRELVLLLCDLKRQRRRGAVVQHTPLTNPLIAAIHLRGIMRASEGGGGGA